MTLYNWFNKISVYLQEKFNDLQNINIDSPYKGVVENKLFIIENNTLLSDEPEIYKWVYNIFTTVKNKA